MEFMRDAAYRQPLLWLSNGWAERQSQHWEAPLYWERRDGEWVTFTMGPGGISDIEVSDQMKLLLEGLGPAETSEVFTQGRTTMWLHVVSVDRPEVRDIYDKQVQRLLAAEIRRRRSEEEWNRYIASLLQRGIYDELDKMAQRLYEIAMLRYSR